MTYAGCTMNIWYITYWHQQPTCVPNCEYLMNIWYITYWHHNNCISIPHLHMIVHCHLNICEIALKIVIYNMGIVCHNCDLIVTYWLNYVLKIGEHWKHTNNIYIRIVNQFETPLTYNNFITIFIWYLENWTWFLNVSQLIWYYG